MDRKLAEFLIRNFWSLRDICSGVGQHFYEMDTLFCDYSTLS